MTFSLVAGDLAPAVPVDARELPTSGARQVVVVSAASVKPERVEWAWEGRIPIGALTVLAGRQGLGKSTLSLELVAQATRGELAGDLYGERCTCIVATLEDHLASVVLPRLTAAGADLRLVQLVKVMSDGAESMLTLPDDVIGLTERAEDHGARLIVVDPLVATFGGAVDSHKDASVRRILQPLAQLAESQGLAVIATMHLNKALADDLLSNVSGSIAFTAAPRSVLLFARHPDDPDGEDGSERVIAHTKCNVGPRQPALECRVVSRQLSDPAGGLIETSQLLISGECSITSDDLSRRREDRSAVEEAVEELVALLEDGEWRPAKDVRGILVQGRKIAKRTLDRAADRLGVEREERGFPARAFWRLPPVAPTLLRQTAEQALAQQQNPNNDGRFDLVAFPVAPHTDGGATGANSVLDADDLVDRIRAITTLPLDEQAGAYAHLERQHEQPELLGLG